MRQSGGARPTTRGIESAAVADRLAAFLRACHPAKTSIAVAAETGIPVATVDKWLERTSVPNGRALLALVAFYGPELLAALFDRPPAWLDAAARQAEQDRLQAEIARLKARLSRPEGAPCPD